MPSLGVIALIALALKPTTSKLLKVDPYCLSLSATKMAIRIEFLLHMTYGDIQKDHQESNQRHPFVTDDNLTNTAR